MSPLVDLIAEMDRVDALPVAARAAERLTLYRRVESALRQCALREATLSDAARKARPALRELSIRLTALEKIAPREVPDPEMMREYRAALARAMRVLTDLEKTLP